MESDFQFEVTRDSLRAFERSILEFMAVSGKGIGEILRQQARLIAVNLAHNTQPYGLGADARKQGEAAAVRDVAKIYRSIDTVYALIADQSKDAARAFYAAAINGRLDVAKHILRGCGLTGLLGADIGPFDKSIHKQMRDRRGRVSIRSPRQIVTDPKVLREYTKLVVKHVGAAKSSWASCAEQIGGVRGIPLWATRNRARGTVQDLSRHADDPRVILSSGVDYMPTVLPDRMQADAVDKQRNKMQTSIRITLEKAARTSRLVA